MKTKGAKRRKIPEHYIETLIALDAKTVLEAAQDLHISYQGLYERIRRMDEWFGQVVILGGKGFKPQLTERGRSLMVLWLSGLSDENILYIMENNENKTS